MSNHSAISLLTDDDVYLFNEGSHFHLYEKLGGHLVNSGDAAGTCFAVWAPDAEQVFVMGDFNGWDKTGYRLQPKGNSGIWQGFYPGIGKGTLYKYHIASRFHGYRVDKADPFSIFNEIPPKTASIVWDLDYVWGDGDWMANRHQFNRLDKPMAIYEMHLGSWRRIEQEGNRSLSYRELAPQLADYLQRLGYTHVELLPVMDHPFFGSWGYQITGYFAPSGNFGTPQDLMYLIDYLHQRGVGVILDWVPSHFPIDEHGLGFFDGTHLYEHADSRQGYHPEWTSYIFNYGRKEVQSFLISNALFWLDRYHVDGLRVDAVASMIYLDYARNDGEWIPNKYGGRENIEAIANRRLAFYPTEILCRKPPRRGKAARRSFRETRRAYEKSAFPGESAGAPDPSACSRACHASNPCPTSGQNRGRRDSSAATPSARQWTPPRWFVRLDDSGRPLH